MYKVVHLAAECYPIAKTGGLGDVVGALPKYLNKAEWKTCVVLPHYNQKWVHENKKVNVWQGRLNNQNYDFTYYINFCEEASLGFDAFLVDIPDLIYRDNVYGYEDDHLRFLFFQQAALDWICNWDDKPAILHCHDHHTGLIPFMIKNCAKYAALNYVKTVFTIHNGLYMGAFAWYNSRFLPDFWYHSTGLLDWDNAINPLAAAIKCCDYLTTVSEGYLDELKFQPNPLQTLYNQFWAKSKGIVNGIDTELWNPKKDTYLKIKLARSVPVFKAKNKEAICKAFSLNKDLPLIIFIGRLVAEKGGDLLPNALGHYLSQNHNINFIILGSGTAAIENHVKQITAMFSGNVANYIGYNEGLAHELYAAADFIIMPSIIEPCGLNQMYAMRYGTIPIVRTVGGLKDTVVDIGDDNGYGIRFNLATTGDIYLSLMRAVELYNDKKRTSEIRNKIVSLNFSWDLAAKKYIDIYLK